MGAAHRSWLRFVLALAAAFAIVPLWAAVPSALAAGDANTASCPGSTESSPGFRTYLPDCRAYELVTPPYKAGDFVAGEGASISPTGTALLGESLANFADEAPKVVGDPLNPYLFQRTPTGWTTSALLSPAEAALLVRPGKTIYRILFRGRDDESGRTLWSVLYRAGDELNLESIFYIEQPDGSFEELGPATPGPAAPNSFPTTSVGISNYAVSPGLTHVVFGGIDSELTLGEKWPGDTTAVGRENLFEYTSADKEEPRLVAVRNQHSLASNTEAELISSCGSFLGASFGDKRGALSDGGQEVIFTVAGGEGFECAGPPVDEIYVREGGERTLAISEPSHEDCEECNVTSGLESPVFQAASADGSKIYFTTSQELLPGATGSNLYVYDLAASPGHKVTQVSSGAGEAGVQGIVRISEDGSHAYFVATGVLTGENAEHNSPSSGLDNLYVFERDSRFPAGQLTFVATLAGGDEADWQAGDFSHPAAATPDGKFLTFTSRADLTSGDTSTQPQLFEYDARAQTLTRISIGQHSAQYPGGFNNDGNTTSEIDRVTIAQPYDAVNSDAAGSLRRTMSEQGNVIFFQSPRALTPEASEDVKAARLCGFGVETEAGECQFGENPVYVQNVYEYRWSSNVADGNVYLISGGQDASAFREGEAVELLGTDANGSNVFFTTSEALVPQDLDTQVDIYDARAEGGFGPAAIDPACGAARACEGTVTPTPQLPIPGSAVWPGGENLAAPVAAHPSQTRLSRSAKLRRALQLCRRKPRRGRRRCDAAARRRYGPAPISKHAEA